MTRINLGESFVAATKGIYLGISKDRNTKIHLVIGFIVLISAFLLEISKIDFILISIVCFLVIVLELFNNCIERVIDAITPYYNKELGKAKDILAGIVLIADFLAVVIGLLIFYKPLIKILNIPPIYPLILLTIINIILFVIIIFVFIKEKVVIQKLSLRQQL